MSKCTMCIDRLEKGKKPVCVLSCPLRAFDFGLLDELIEKYGDVRYVTGMDVSPEVTRPASLFWNQREKEKVVPYDTARAIELNEKRDALGDMFKDAEDLTGFEEGTIGRDKLVMKHKSAEDLMRATRNDMA